MIDFKNFIFSNDLIEEVKIFDRSTYLIREGEIVKHVFWIKKGTIRAFVLDEDGNEQIIRFGYPGNIISSLSAIFKNEKSDLYLHAIKKCEVLVIPVQKLWDIKTNSDFSAIWMKMLEDLVCQQIEREKDLLIADPKLRFERVFRRSPALFQEIPLKHIANYLKMTPETLSRIRKS